MVLNICFSKTVTSIIERCRLVLELNFLLLLKMNISKKRLALIENSSPTSYNGQTSFVTFLGNKAKYIHEFRNCYLFLRERYGS